MEPSIGSITASSPEPPSPVIPDSSESTRQAGAVQHGEGRPVGGQVEPVLPRLSPARPPVLEHVERATHGADRLVEHFQEPNVVHG